ncbi:CD209 antigen-like protein E [Tiliqua scincoides]|uniref:CD209 antigen-like protein E n=1 Tax=Tiliqua scincoides TaxID=71010 RepID=UPI003461D41D
MYDDTELPNREQGPSVGNWPPLPRKPSTEAGNSDVYEAFNEQDDYGSISYAKEELKAEAQPPDPDIKADTDAAVFSELRKLNLSSAQESFDPSTVSLMIHELNSSLITELQILEERINERSEATNKNVNEQLFRLEKKMNSSLQDLKGTSNRCVPLPWKEFQGHHYYFSEFEEQWGKAKELCVLANAHLLVINNQQEQDFVISQISTAVWLGLSDIATEGTWSWVDGSPVAETFWGNGEPNNSHDEDCVVLYKEKNWNDIACHRKVRFVCEKI